MFSANVKKKKHLTFNSFYSDETGDILSTLRFRRHLRMHLLLTKISRPRTKQSSDTWGGGGGGCKAFFLGIQPWYQNQM